MDPLPGGQIGGRTRAPAAHTVSRRHALKVGGVVAGAVWAAPVIESFTSRAAALSGGVTSCNTDTSIGSDFNGTDVASGKLIWFNAVFMPSFAGGLTKAQEIGEVTFTDQTVTIVDAGVTTVLNLPNSTIIFSGSVTTPTTSWTGTAWMTEVPAGFSDNVFLGGFLWHLTSALPGGANPVTWAGTITLTGALRDVEWKWAAAAFNDFAGSDNSNVKPAPVDASGTHAGTPGNINMQNAIGGARGGGSANTTGSYSGTSTASCTP